MKFLTPLPLIMLLSTVAVAGQPMVLPDSDEVPVEKSAFYVDCTDTELFAEKMRKSKAVPLLFGVEARDSSILMGFAFEDGSIIVARTNKEGTSTCIFGNLLEPDVNVGTVLGLGKKKGFQP